MKRDRISRRAFLRDAAVVASLGGLAGCGLLPREAAPRRPRPIGEREKLNIACVGVGGKGRSDVDGVAGERLVAFCDVDGKQAAATFKKYPDVPRFNDYRKMLEELDDKIDAVVVTTPDHMHFPVALAAIERGKHVYVQKPLTHSIGEARMLAEAALKHGVATQMGNQGHAGESPRRIYEWVRSGVIGPVREVHLWTNRPIWPQGIERPKEQPPVPQDLDWDLWLGVAPNRPYNPAYAPFKWRGWWDFGCGALGDMGCHIMDASFWALDLRRPISVEAETSPVNEETAPEWAIVAYQFPKRGAMPSLMLKWYDGGKKPPRPKELEPERELGEGGQLIVGEKATILVAGESPRIIPETRMRELQPSFPEPYLPRIPEADAYKEWIRACKGGPKAGSNIVDHSGPLTEVVLLGNVAIRCGKKIEWDSVRMKTNLSEADRYIRRSYRDF